MKVPEATSLERSAAASCSAAAGGGKTYGNKKNPSATPRLVPSTPPSTKIAMPRQNLFIAQSPVRSGQLSVSIFQPNREKRGGCERQCNPRDAGRPSDPVEHLT